MKHPIKTRLLKLMDLLEWGGISNWAQMKSALQDQEILPFKRWVRTHLQYIVTERAREVAEAYYLDGDKLNYAKGTHAYQKTAALVLAGVYKIEQELIDG